MINELSIKILTAFGSESFNERDLVFVLSRIRKILESENSFGRYKFLSLYCNWALHVQIEKTEMLSKLGIFIQHDLLEDEVKFMSHQYFFEELDEFNKEYLNGDLEIFVPDRRTHISDLLNEILSNTPLIICKSDKVKVQIVNESGKTHWRAEYI